VFLIQILLPLFDNIGKQFERELFAETERELAGRFGGLTAFTRAPARGIWQDEHDRTRRDEIVVLEVMASAIDAPWWSQYRSTLERRFRQNSVVVRAEKIQLL